MDETWIVTANAGRARFFTQAKAGEALHELNDMVSATVRLRTSETEPDRIGPLSAGKSIHNTGGALPTSGYEPPQTPAEHETELFARSITGFLLEQQQAGRFRHLVLAASPQFLGTLRQLLDPHVKALVKTELNKDYTQLNAQQLREQIQH